MNTRISIRSFNLSISALLALAAVCLLPLNNSHAEEVAADQPATEGSSTAATSSEQKQEKVLQRITIVGDQAERKRIAGSAQMIEQKKIEDSGGAFSDINRVLRQVPGVNIQEEDGFGLRPNIGLRGTPSERSASITLMEDGVLIAPAPYAAPSAYYFPTAGRMSGVEVTKGPGSIKYGPRTTGGAVNLISTPIPSKQNAHVTTGVGTDNTMKLWAHGGQSFKYGGAMLETYQLQTDGFKDLDGGGDTGFDLEDYLTKFRINTDPEQDVYHQLEVKLQSSNQDSDETYLGLTDEDFDDDPNRRYAGSQVDNIDVDHQQFQARYFGELGENLDVTGTFYYNDTNRNWYKLQSVGGSSLANILDNPDDFADKLSYIKGATSKDDELKVRANKRDYFARGYDLVVGYDNEIGPTKHEIELGARYHKDEEDRFQHEDGYRMDNGTMVRTSQGAAGSQSNRVSTAEAWAFYMQDVISWGAFTLSPGVRYETIDYERRDYGKSNPNRTQDEVKRTTNDIDKVIPGMGAHYQINEMFGSFVGVHRGFNPPGPSGNSDVEEEESINYELGGTMQKDSFWGEVVFFYNDYDNLLGADTLSGGGEGTGDLFNGGEVDVIGVETLFRYDFAELVDTHLRFPANFTYTYTNAEFKEDFDSDFFGDVRDGDDVPYIPENQLAGNISVEDEKWRFQLGFHYVDAMPTVAGQAGTRSEEKTDDYFIVDALAELTIFKSVRLFTSAQNLFDEEYVVARRPSGARPGLPFTMMAGLKFDLG